MRWTGHNAAIYTVAGWMLRLANKTARKPSCRPERYTDRKETFWLIGASILSNLAARLILWRLVARATRHWSRKKKRNVARCRSVSPSVCVPSPSLRYAFCARNDILSVYLSRISNNQSSREVDLRGVTKFVQRSSPINHSTVEASRQVYR